MRVNNRKEKPRTAWASFPPSHLDAVQKIARDRGISFNEAFRQILKEWLVERGLVEPDIQPEDFREYFDQKVLPFWRNRNIGRHLVWASFDPDVPTWSNLIRELDASSRSKLPEIAKKYKVPPSTALQVFILFDLFRKRGRVLPELDPLLALRMTKKARKRRAMRQKLGLSR